MTVDNPFAAHVAHLRLHKQLKKHHREELEAVLDANWLKNTVDGNLPRWKKALAELPIVENIDYNIDQDTVTISTEQQVDILPHLQVLMPWRKGPFNVFGTDIETEWRSDWKWQRIAPHLPNLKDLRILDVGCANGYHCWRMKAAGAQSVTGIDPGKLPVAQFLLTNHYIQDPSVAVLPMTLEEYPDNTQAHDLTFSLGVLYHRRSPLDHLEELRRTLKPGGTLVLETMVIDGKLGEALVPEGRYAKMNNVWFLPTPETLCSWLTKMGFEDPTVVDTNQTALDEQRSTEWKPGKSLADYLDPNDRNLTVEGHPAPIRATIIAKVPEAGRLKRYHE